MYKRRQSNAIFHVSIELGCGPLFVFLTPMLCSYVYHQELPRPLSLHLSQNEF